MWIPKWFLLFLVVLVIGVGVLPLFRYLDGNSRRSTPILRCRTVVLACQSYRKANEAGGSFPSRIADLMRPPFGGPPVLEDRTVKDGWGKPLRYAVVVQENGDEEVYVWAERDTPGAVEIFGAKGTADGRIVLFNRPAD